MLYITGSNIKDFVSMIITVMEQNEGHLPAFLRSECKDGLSKSSDSTVMAFYQELAAKYPSALQYF